MQNHFCYLNCKLDTLPHLTFIVSTRPQMTSLRRLLLPPTEASIYNSTKAMWNVPFFQIYSTRAFANPIIRFNNTIQERAFMDEATFLDWTNAAWHSFCLNIQPTCPIMDSCAVHESSSIKEALRKLGTKIPYITKRLYLPITRVGCRCLPAFETLHAQAVREFHERRCKKTLPSTHNTMGY